MTGVGAKLSAITNRKALFAGLFAALATGALVASGIGLAQQSAMPLEPQAEPAVAASPEEPDINAAVAGLETMFGAESELSFTGAVVAVVADGKIVTVRGYGSADPVEQIPVDPTMTPFALGSVTKTLIGTLTAQMLTDGTLAALDVPVNAYLTRTTIPDNGGDAITVRMLATHQAGFADMWQPFMAEGDDLPPQDSAFFERELPPFIRPVLSGPAYSNFGIGLLSATLEDASGGSLDSLTKERIFDPAGMDTARIVRDPSDMEGVAQGQIFYPNGGVRPIPPTWANSPINRAAGGMVASGNDMARYMLALLGGSQSLDIPAIVSDEEQTLMFSRQGEAHPLVQGFGLTFMINDWNGTTLAEHGGRTLGASSYMTLLPDEKIGIFVAVTGDNGTTLPFAGLLGKPSAPGSAKDAKLPVERPLLSTIRAAYLHPLLGRYAPPIPIEKIDADLGEYVGDYIGERRPPADALTLFRKFFLGGGSLEITRGADGTLNVGPFGLYEPVGNDVFYKVSAREQADRMEGVSGWHDVLAFRRDEQGAVDDFVYSYSDMMYRKTDSWVETGAVATAMLLATLTLLTGLLALFWPKRRRGRAVAMLLPPGLIALPIVFFRSWPSSSIEPLAFLTLRSSDLVIFQLFCAIVAVAALYLAIVALPFGKPVSRPAGKLAATRLWFARLHHLVLALAGVMLLIGMVAYGLLPTP